ncbi:hypothetical protein [Mycobacterium parmense]|uniref:hypothetical protein n=1 Tax=Mycobacterium parmense TaxID=185642 RepID=UPI001B80BD7D|nr:hypothetical protein [Mycobacterium parmense]MCV7349854.1 hypothetical protein [Mycobacterium parmense]
MAHDVGLQRGLAREDRVAAFGSAGISPASAAPQPTSPAVNALVATITRHVEK